MMLNHYLILFGRVNFDRLNDVVNKVDSLISYSFLQALKEDDRTNPNVCEYYKQLDLLKQIYADMAEHSLKHKLDYSCANTTEFAKIDEEVTQ